MNRDQEQELPCRRNDEDTVLRVVEEAIALFDNEQPKRAKERTD